MMCQQTLLQLIRLLGSNDSTASAGGEVIDAGFIRFRSPDRYDVSRVGERLRKSTIRPNKDNSATKIGWFAVR